MNMKNADYLKDSLKYLGFGEGLHSELEKKLQENSPGFKLSHKADFNGNEMNATLHFRKSDQSDMYFFNKYDAALAKDQSLSQTFYLQKGSGHTLKEAFNLLNGRAVYKELENAQGEKYKAWQQLDFSQKTESGNFKVKQFTDNHGYNLESALAKHPIKELSDSQWKDKLLKSLEKGNVQAVKMEKDGREQLMFVSANPQFKTINLFDGHMKKVQKSSLKEGKSASMSMASEEDAPKAAKRSSKRPSIS